jgi:shikimate kinase
VKGQKIALIGFMGCGKSSIGRILASRLTVPFIDMDQEIEKGQGRTIREIFDNEGESAFRKMEERTLSDIAGRGGNLILSCGGGIVVSPANRSLLACRLLTVWIDVPFSELMRRLKDERESRPLLNSDDYENKARALLKLRRPLYREASRLSYRWKAGDSTTDSAGRIMELFDENLA